MKEKINEIIHSKKIIVILIIVLIVLVGAASTYAWFTWSSTNNTSLTMSIGELADVNFSTGNDISTTSLAPVFNYTDGEKTAFNINNKTDTEISYKVLLNITSIADELKSSSLKYKLLSGTTVVAEGDFSNITSNSSTSIYNGTLSNGSVNFTFYLYIDGNIENDLSMMGKSLSGNIMIEANKTPSNLASYLIELYSSADKTKVINNGITYNYATSINLMNDRLGSSSSDIDGGNIRYYGEAPDNYIYFNCNDYSNQTSDSCEVWRIIGVFDIQTPDSSGGYTTEKKVKILRENKIGEYAYDTSARTFNSGYGINQWGSTSSYEGADLMRLLNSGYESNSINNSLYWNAGSGTCYTTYYDVTMECDFTSSGLKNDLTRGVISKSKWNLGGADGLSFYADGMYTIERGTNVITSPSEGVARTTSWDGYVGLIYPSDILYTADFRVCTDNMSDIFATDSTTCSYSTSWLASLHYNQRGSDYSSYGFWTLTPGTFLSEFVYKFYGSGFSISKAATGWTLNNGSKDGGVIPSLYLDANVFYKNGDGSSSSPYQLDI